MISQGEIEISGMPQISASAQMLNIPLFSPEWAEQNNAKHSLDVHSWPPKVH